jgi:hypothetical protein
MRTPRRLAANAIVIAVALAASGAPAAAAAPVDLATLVASWPASFRVSGVKTEPTYLETLDIARNGDVFSVLGGAPAFAERSLESVRVDAAGKIAWISCPAPMDCTTPGPPSGFLATAAAVAAWRKGTLGGSATPVAFGARTVVCIPAEKLGVTAPILDPCFDQKTGAVLAQRHRLSGAFDGPTLEASTLKIAAPEPRVLSATLPKTMESTE